MAWHDRPDDDFKLVSMICKIQKSFLSENFFYAKFYFSIKKIIKTLETVFVSFVRV